MKITINVPYTKNQEGMTEASLLREIIPNPVLLELLYGTESVDNMGYLTFELVYVSQEIVDIIKLEHPEFMF